VVKTDLGVSTITIGEVVGLPSVPVLTTLDVVVVTSVPVQYVVMVDSGVSTTTIGNVVGLLSVPVVTILDVVVVTSVPV